MFASFIAVLLAAAPAQAAPNPIGTWVNRKGTVTVRTERCGSAICGRVVAAAPSAEEAARAAGTGRLVGTEILHRFRPAGGGRWLGRAFIPDLGVTVDATMTQLGRDSLQIEGCGGYLCKRQVWRRAARAARR